MEEPEERLAETWRLLARAKNQVALIDSVDVEAGPILDDLTRIQDEELRDRIEQVSDREAEELVAELNERDRARGVRS